MKSQEDSSWLKMVTRKVKIVSKILPNTMDSLSLPQAEIFWDEHVSLGNNSKCTKIFLLDSPHLQGVALKQYCIIQLLLEKFMSLDKPTHCSFNNF